MIPTIMEAVAQLSDGTTTSRALTEACLEQAEKRRNLGAFLYLDAKAARQAADQSDARRRAGTTLGPLDGIPVAHKDMLCTQDMPTTAASRILEGYVPPYDATVVARWRGAGTVLLGKLNQDEFGMGSSTENSAFLLARNPWDGERTPGGSSGGSAVAVSTGMCLGATGTDTGGSIRQPAAFTGIVGVKPTYGRVSRFGVMAYASSLDQVGVLARTVEDAATLLSITWGHDPQDATSVAVPPPDLGAALNTDPRGVRVGIPLEFLDTPGMDAEVGQAFRDACGQLERLGMGVREVRLPHTRYALPAYYVIAPAECSANLARYDGIRYGPRRGNGKDLRSTYQETRGQLLGPEVKRRVVLGTFVLSSGYHDAYYGQAQRARAWIQEDFRKVFEEVDVVVSPTSPTPAFPLAQKVRDPVQMYLSDVFTLSCNLAGLPGMSLPCGFSAGPKPLPIGLQLMAKPLDEEGMFRVAHAYQQATDWHRHQPPGVAS